MNPLRHGLSRGCASLVDKASLPCGKSVDLDELFPNTITCCTPGECLGEETGDRAGQPKLSYAAPFIFIHNPQPLLLSLLNSRT